MLTRTLPILLGNLVIAAACALAAGGEHRRFPAAQALPRDLLPFKDDAPMRAAAGGVRADTAWYGSYQVIGGEYYALRSNEKRNVMWTFDRGNGPFPPLPARSVIPNGEGWLAEDLTEGPVQFFRAIDAALNLGDLPGGGAVPAPIIAGLRSLWVGADQPTADGLCWSCRAGYGNTWCQRAFSPTLTYDGSGDVILAMSYWSDTESCYDGTQIYLRRDDNTELLLNPYQPAGTCGDNLAWDGGFTGRIGTFDANGILTGVVNYNRPITQAEFSGSATFQIVVEFASDPGASDEDCRYATAQGPFGADGISLTNNLIGGNVVYNFETGLQGWTPASCNPVGHFVSVVDVRAYTILDPCACRLENNVIEMHAGVGDGGVHPVGQYSQIVSPICDLDPGLKVIFMEFDMYAELPRSNGVLFRPCWSYYPFVCPATGVVGWSPVVGQDRFNFVGDDPVCATWRYGGTEVVDGVPLPADADLVRAHIQVLASCETFTIDPCTDENANFTPLFDNIAVGATAGISAPSISFDNGTRYQDNGSFPSALFDVRAPVPANITRDKHADTAPGTARDLLGDSLVVSGPIPGVDPNTRWEARMWWRVARRGPFQADRENGVNTRYMLWKDRVSKGFAIDRPYRAQFTWGWMDSVQVGAVVSRSRFKSDYRENESQFLGENHPETEMIWDDALRPGTQIEYFITASYAGTPNRLFYLPDTTGQFFYEFEGLPGIRTANVANCGGAGIHYCVFHPATLYIDAYNVGAQFYIENALRTVLNGLDPCLDEDGCVIPADRNWDRYDYLDASSNWNAGIARGSVAGSNNGFTVNQVLGYRAMILNTGIFGEGCMQDEDFPFFDNWLLSPDCGANLTRQVFIMNGDKAGELLELPGGVDSGVYGPAFLANTLGALVFCDAFNGATQDPDCAPENTSHCLRLLPVGGGAFGMLIDVDAYGNYCPNLYGFNVYSVNAGGRGNRTYSAEDPPKVMSFAQVVNENLGGGANYRTVLDGVSYHHMSKRNPGGAGNTFCPRDTPSIVDGSLSELRAALRWGFGAADDNGLPKLVSAKTIADCQQTWGQIPTDVGDGIAARVNRLYQNEPNPFNPRTTIRFSLASPGEVRILIYDVNGRMVRTLVDGKKDAGPHSAVWDGTNDEGRKVGSGVYWSQMKAGSYVSNKKMVILK